MAANDRNKGTKKFQKSYFDVLGLCCSSEIPLIEKILKPLEGIEEVSVIVPSRTVIVIHDDLLISQIQIVKALNQARLEANVRVYGEAKYRKKWPNQYAMASGLFLILSLFKFLYHPMQWFALAAAIVGLPHILFRSIAAIRNLTLDINILMLIAVGGTLALKDFLEAGTIVFLFTIAEWLESRASHKATAFMSSVMNMAPQKAVLAENGLVVDAKDVKVNTVLAVKAGDAIPIDGVVVEGNCEVDEKTLTGESFPVSKQTNSTVWAGTINLNGYVSVKTTALAEDCVVAKMATLVEEAQQNKSKIQKFIDKCTMYYTPAVVLISIGFAAIPAALRVHNLKHWLHLALVVLVSACPCALILSTPVATFCALTKAATSGILIKGGDYLEILAKVKIMAFDKTGTITRGEFVVTDFRSICNDINLNTLIYWVSSIESKSSHPMAASLIDYGGSKSIEPKPEHVKEFQNFPGEGIYGEIEGKAIYVGNRRIATRAGCHSVPDPGDEFKEGQTIGYIYSEATLVGMFSLSDACRSGVLEAINELKSLGIKTAMLTGDSHSAAMHAQNQLGNALEIVHAELLPEQKVRIIEDFKKNGATAMIGDGINDAPALATADIGISMGISGSALATETGHVTLMSNDFRKIPKAIKLGRKTRQKVIENVALSFITKSAIIALAIAGHPLLWAAVLADVGTCLLVILNSMLLLQGTSTRPGKKCCSPSHATHVHKHGSPSGCGHLPHGEHGAAAGKKCCSPSHATHVHKHGSESGCAHLPHGEHGAAAGKKCCSPSHATHVHKHGSESGCEHLPHEEHGAVAGKKLCSPSHAIHVHRHGSESGCGHLPQGEHGAIAGKPDEIHDPCSHSTHIRQQCCSHHEEDQGTTKTKDSDQGEKHTDDRLESGSMQVQGDRCVDCSHGESRKSKETSCGGCLHDCENDTKWNILETSHDISEASHVCMDLEKREIGGCCKSFRKECGGNNGCFGVGLGGGLSEIITE